VSASVSTVTLPDIRSLVPHAGPMVLLDRVVAVDEESLCAELEIKCDTLFCDGKEVGAWIGVEYMAQAIAAHAGYLASLRGESAKIGFLLGSRRYECNRPSFIVGEVLQVSVQRALQGENGLGAFECRIDVAGENKMANETAGIPAAKATITVFQPNSVVEFMNGRNEGGL
jgi:predicted hotdog family 3-hydroxylacyl-ACP dehydratase